MSYIPGSFRTGNPIAIPNYLKGSTRLHEIEERGNAKNNSRKEAFAEISLDMTRAVVLSDSRRKESDVEDQVHQDNENYFRTSNCPS